MNARYCNRTHCKFTGPFFLLMTIPVMLLGQTKIESTVIYLGVEVDDALEIAEKSISENEGRAETLCPIHYGE